MSGKITRSEVIRRLGSISENALERIVYVVGMARGGTTIVRDSIGIHNNILMLPGMTHFVSQVWQYRKKVHMRLLRQIVRLPSFYRDKEVIQRLEKARGADLRMLTDKDLASRDLKLMWQMYPIVYGLDECNQKDPGNILCWGDKTNDCRELERICRSFGKSKFVFVVRDPRDAVSSMAKRSATRDLNDRAALIEKGRIVEFCIYWRNMAQTLALFSKRHPERTTVIKFEQFVREPENILNGIFRFILGKSIMEKEMERRLRNLSYRATNDANEKGTGISAKPVGRWKGVLAPDEVELIEKLTGVTARKFGYDLNGSMSLRDYLSIVSDLESMRGRGVLGGKLAFLAIREDCI